MYRNIEDFINDWKTESEATLSIFRLITEERRNEKIHKQVRSLDRLAWHLTQTLTEMGCAAGLFGKDELHDRPSPSSITELAEVYQSYSTLIARAVKLKWTDSSLGETLPMYGEEWEKGKVLRVIIAHQTHHRGQMTVIMRLLGLPVPGLYGPSAEEWANMGLPAME